MTNEQIVETAIEKLQGILQNIKSIYTNKELDEEELHNKLLIQASHFEGIADVLILLTGKEYHWSTADRVAFRIVTFEKDIEETIYQI